MEPIIIAGHGASSRAVTAIAFSLLAKLAVASPVRRLGLFL
jgi:hypothetical protein